MDNANQNKMNPNLRLHSATFFLHSFLLLFFILFVRWPNLGVQRNDIKSACILEYEFFFNVNSSFIHNIHLYDETVKFARRKK